MEGQGQLELLLELHDLEKTGKKKLRTVLTGSVHKSTLTCSNIIAGMKFHSANSVTEPVQHAA
jgi:hypothetical protein